MRGMSGYYTKKNGSEPSKAGLYGGLLALFTLVLWLGSSLLGAGAPPPAPADSGSERTREQIGILFARLERLERSQGQLIPAAPATAPAAPPGVEPRRVDELESRVGDLERRLDAVLVELEADREAAAEARAKARASAAASVAAPAAARRAPVAAPPTRTAAKAPAPARPRSARGRRVATRTPARPAPRKPAPAPPPEVGPDPTGEGEPPEGQALARSWMDSPEGTRATVLPPARSPTDGLGRTVASLPGDELAGAVATGLPDLLRNLLENGIPADSPTSEGATALHLAARMGLVEQARLLLARGADPNRPDAEGRTPLRLAIDAGYLEVVRLLLDAGATPLSKDHKGDSALRRARLHRDPRIRDLVLARVDPGIVPESYW